METQSIFHNSFPSLTDFEKDYVNKKQEKRRLASLVIIISILGIASLLAVSYYIMYKPIWSIDTRRILAGVWLSITFLAIFLFSRLENIKKIIKDHPGKIM
jgi:tellurite resistance protein TehA-like permease